MQRLFLSMLIVFGMAGSGQAALVSVDLVADPYKATVFTATSAGFKANINAIGQNATNDQIGVWENGPPASTVNWWNYIGLTATAGSLVDANNNVTSLTVGVTNYTNLASNWTTLAPNDDLVNDGYYSTGTGTVTTTIGGLTSGQAYDLIVYHADDYVAELVTVNGVSPVNYTGTFANAYSDAFDGLANSDFWYFRNLTPNALNQLVISSGGGASGQVGLGSANTITGFQLVSLPEPSSLTLLLVGGAIGSFVRGLRKKRFLRNQEIRE